MDVYNRDQIKQHITSHSESSVEDRAAVTTLESFLLSEGRINADFSKDDKWPNHDGRFEFVSNPVLSKKPEQVFIVQIKGTHSYNKTEDGVSFCLRSLAFPAFIADEVTADPGILFVVLDPDQRGKQRVFWKYMSPSFLQSIDFSHNSATIYFSNNDEITYTEQSIDDFCKKLEQISEHHLFLRKLNKEYLTKEDAIKIIEARCEDVSMEIENIQQDYSSRDKFSKRILSYLYDLCYASLILNAYRLGYPYVNEQIAFETAKFHIGTKYLCDFLEGLKYINRRIPKDGQSERLMLKYHSYLWEIRCFLRECFQKSVLENLESFPLDLDTIDTEYYELIAASIETNFINTSVLTKSRYFILKKTPFFVNGERYFEVTLQLAGKYATKFNRLTVYTKINFSSNYSIQIAYSDVNFTLWGKSNTIKFVTGWRVSIAPTCLNLLGKILQIPLQLNWNYGEYSSLMDFLTETGMTLLDLINLNDNRFNQVINKLFESTNTQYLHPVLMRLRNCYSYQSNQFGSHTIRYLLLNFREEVLEALLPSLDENKQLSGDLFLSRKCYPFEKNPFISNISGRKSRKSSTLDLSAITNNSDILREMLPFRIIEHLIQETGEIYFEPSLVAPMQDIQIYNNSLDAWEKSEGFGIDENNGLLSINSYVTTTMSILKRLTTLSLIPNSEQQRINERFLRNCCIPFDDPLKPAILKTAFVKSHLLLIYGAAGTGKTRLIKHLSVLFENKTKLFLAKTHTALQHLRREINLDLEYTSFESVDSFTKKESTVFYDVVFVDECSTIDNRSMKGLLDRLSDKTLLVLAGDIYQIESIEFGNWFFYAKDIIKNSDANVELSSTWRTENQELRTLWNEVRQKKSLIVEKLAIDGPFSSNIGEEIFISEDEDEIILCLNYDGKFGLNNMNMFLQNANNNSPPYTWAEWTFKIGDKVIFLDTKRSSLLYNNLKGKIVNICKSDSSIDFTLDIDTVLTPEQCIGESFDFIKSNEKTTRIRLTVLAETENIEEEQRVFTIVPFQIAYAVSIHKAQGLEYNSVKVIIPPINAEKITHAIFYTAITRAKKKLKIFWSPETMETIVSGFTESSVKQQSLDIIKSKLESES